MWQWLLVILVSEASAFFLAKQYSISANILTFFGAVIAYAFVVYALIQILKGGQGLGVTNCIWSIASILYGVAIGFFLFGEKLTNRQKAGIILALIATFLILAPVTVQTKRVTV
jgi:multidrug transporter EmrE-like cation transporter